jgi:predicted ATP-grasp superfamily ATP-dependent carboligase
MPTNDALDLAQLRQAAEVLSQSNEQRPWSMRGVQKAYFGDDTAGAIATVLNALPQLLALAEEAERLHEQAEEDAYTIERLKRESIYDDD